MAEWFKAHGSQACVSGFYNVQRVLPNCIGFYVICNYHGMENEKQATQDPYIKTDKAEYTLGDTIQVRGLRKIPKPSCGLDGKFLEKEIDFTISLKKEKNTSLTGFVTCEIILEEDQKVKIKTEYGDWYHSNMKVTRHDLNDDGTFGFDVVVLNNYEAGTYIVNLRQSEEKPYNVFDYLKSPPFKIVGVA